MRISTVFGKRLRLTCEVGFREIIEISHAATEISDYKPF
jgi:hypothetical protein